MLVGKKINITRAVAMPVSAARGLATYIDAEGIIRYAATCDMAFLAGVGAALAMIPPNVVLEAVKTGKPSPVLLENAFEVMNIVASLYNDPEGIGTHVKFKDLVVAPPLAPDMVPRLAKPAARIDFGVSVPGYGDGKLSLLALS